MPMYLTGYIDDHTDRLKNYHDDILPLGMIVQPKSFREGYLSKAGLYGWVAIDNGRFTEAGRRLFRHDEYDRLIGEGLGRAGDHLLFATAPDVPFDWAETLRLSRPWLDRIRGLGAPAALVAQEGMTPDGIPWDEFDALFIGGADAFKEGPLVRAACREARRRGKWVHMGRVNGLRRLLIALDFGVDSVDGTYLLHEARNGRADRAPHDVVGWLRRVHVSGVVGCAGAWGASACRSSGSRPSWRNSGDTASPGVTNTPSPEAGAMDETPEEWLERLFEFEFCAECGGDADDHEVCIVPGMGTYFARCLRRADDCGASPNGADADGPTEPSISRTA